MVSLLILLACGSPLHHIQTPTVNATWLQYGNVTPAESAAFDATLETGAEQWSSGAVEQWSSGAKRRVEEWRWRDGGDTPSACSS